MSVARKVVLLLMLGSLLGGCANTLITDDLASPLIERAGQHHLSATVGERRFGVQYGLGITDRIALIGQLQEYQASFDELEELTRSYSAALGTHRSFKEGVIEAYAGVGTTTDRKIHAPSSSNLLSFKEENSLDSQYSRWFAQLNAGQRVRFGQTSVSLKLNTLNVRKYIEAQTVRDPITQVYINEPVNNYSGNAVTFDAALKLMLGSPTGGLFIQVGHSQVIGEDVIRVDPYWWTIGIAVGVGL